MQIAFQYILIEINTSLII